MRRFGQGFKLEKELKGKFIIGFFLNIYNQNLIYIYIYIYKHYIEDSSFSTRFFCDKKTPSLMKGNFI